MTFIMRELMRMLLETRSQDISKGVKIKPIWDASQVAALEGLPTTLQGPPPHKACWGYKRPQTPPDQKEESS